MRARLLWLLLVFASLCVATQALTLHARHSPRSPSVLKDVPPVVDSSNIEEVWAELSRGGASAATPTPSPSAASPASDSEGGEPIDGGETDPDAPPHIIPVGPEIPKRPPIHPIGPEIPRQPLHPVGPEIPKPRPGKRPLLPPIGPEPAWPHPIHPVGPERHPSHRPRRPTRPIGPEIPSEQPPHIVPIGPEIPSDTHIRPIGPETGRIRPIGPEVRPQIHPIGPEIDNPPHNTEEQIAGAWEGAAARAKKMEGPEQLVASITSRSPSSAQHSAPSSPSEQLQEDARDMIQQARGRLRHMLDSVFGQGGATEEKEEEKQQGELAEGTEPQVQTLAAQQDLPLLLPFHTPFRQRLQRLRELYERNTPEEEVMPLKRQEHIRLRLDRPARPLPPPSLWVRFRAGIGMPLEHAPGMEPRPMPPVLPPRFLEEDRPFPFLHHSLRSAWLRLKWAREQAPEEEQLEEPAIGQADTPVSPILPPNDHLAPGSLSPFAPEVRERERPSAGGRPHSSDIPTELSDSDVQPLLRVDSMNVEVTPPVAPASAAQSSGYADWTLLAVCLSAALLMFAGFVIWMEARAALQAQTQATSLKLQAPPTYIGLPQESQQEGKENKTAPAIPQPAQLREPLLPAMEQA